MKAKIDKNGDLWIERAGVLKLQICPYTHSVTGAGTYSVPCGDHCPMFQYGEYKEKGVKCHQIALNCGSGTCYLFNRESSILIDERKNEERNPNN